MYNIFVLFTESMRHCCDRTRLKTCARNKQNSATSKNNNNANENREEKNKKLEMRKEKKITYTNTFRNDHDYV